MSQIKFTALLIGIGLIFGAAIVLYNDIADIIGSIVG